MKRKGFTFVEIIIAIMLLTAISVYSIARIQISYARQKAVAYEIQNLCNYARTLARNGYGTGVTLYIQKKERGEYEYALLDTGNRTIWNGVIANDITLYGGKYGSDSIHTKIERLHITFFAQSANEKNKIMTIFIGDKGENISFKITVVPTTGRVYIHEKK